MTKTPVLIASSIAIASIMAACSAQAEGDPQSAKRAILSGEDTLLQMLNTGISRESFVASATQMVRKADSDNDGLDQPDIKRIIVRQQTQERAQRVNQALQFDFDGDLVVTRAEIEEFGQQQNIHRQRNRDNLFEKFDHNNDGRITVKEAAAAPARPQRHRQRQQDRLESLLTLAPTGTTSLTANHLAKIATDIFARFDTDEDGMLSPEEAKPVKPQKNAIREKQRIADAGCVFPKMGSNDLLVSMAAYEGDAISTASIGGSGNETTVIDVTIEQGSKPLYLLLASYESNIWRFSGDTDQVANVVLSSYTTVKKGETAVQAEQQRRVAHVRPGQRGQSASGVIGLPRKKVTITSSNCLSYSNGKRDKETRNLRAEVILGSAPAKMHYEYSPKSVALPSGKTTQTSRDDTPAAPAGFESAMWREAVRFSPSGLVDVDPKSVVAAGKVAPYKVLPSQMGLAQLIGSGAIERLDNRRLRIVKPIAHMPASMGGAHSVTLVVADGVPVPKGDPVHSCVLTDAEAAQSDWQKTCRKSRRRPVEASVSRVPSDR